MGSGRQQVTPAAALCDCFASLAPGSAVSIEIPHIDGVLGGPTVMVLCHDLLNTGSHG